MKMKSYRLESQLRRTKGAHSQTPGRPFVERIQASTLRFARGGRGLLIAALLLASPSVVFRAKVAAQDFESGFFEGTPGPKPTATPRPMIMPSFGNDPVALGHTVFEEMNPELEQAILDAVFNDLPFKVDQLLGLQIPTKEQVAIWSGSTAQMSSNINEFTMSFKFPVGKGEPGEDHPPFEVKVMFDRSYGHPSIVFQHSLPKNKRMRGGIRISHDGKEPHRTFLPGQRGTGLVIIIPRFTRDDTARTFLLCPREYPSATLGDRKVVLRDTGYEIYDTSYVYEAHGTAHLKTGREIGLVRAKILTSPNVKRGEPWTDELYQQAPQVELNYVPVAEDPALVRNKDRNNITGGVQVVFEMHLPTGYKRTSYSQEVSWLRRVSVASALKLFPAVLRNPAKAFSEVKIPVELGPGSCYIFLDEKFTRFDYKEEPLKLPPRLLITPTSTPDVANKSGVSTNDLPFEE